MLIGAGPRGGSGLIGTIPGFHALTHPNTTLASVAETGLLGNTPDGWHHYTFIWNRDGVDFPEAKGKKLLLAIDGKIVASTDEPAEYHNHFRDFSKSLDANPRLNIPWDDAAIKGEGVSNKPIEMSDLKVWNYAKLPALEQGN